MLKNAVRSVAKLQKQGVVKLLKYISFVFIVGCFSFFSGLKFVFAVNTSTAKDNEKRILLESAHGSGYMPNGYDECNHASTTIDGKTYVHDGWSKQSYRPGIEEERNQVDRN